MREAEDETDGPSHPARSLQRNETLRTGGRQGGASRAVPQGEGRKGTDHLLLTHQGC